MNEHEKEFLDEASKDFELEYKKRNNLKSTIIFTIVCTILLTITCTIFYFTFKDLNKEKALYNSLNNMDIISNSDKKIDMKIYSSGDYAKIEKIIKNTYNTFQINYNELNKLYKELNTTNILNIEVYKKDGPSFNNTKKKIEENTKKRNEIINNITDLYSEETINKNIKNNNFNEYFAKLYKKILHEINYKSHVTSIRKYEDTILEHTNKLYEILDYLTLQKENWEISEENELVSYNQEFILKFNDMLNKMK